MRQDAEEKQSAQLRFDSFGTLVSVSLNARNDKEQEALELAVSRVLRPKHSELLQRSLKRFVVPAYCRSLIPKGIAQWLFDFFRLGSV